MNETWNVKSLEAKFLLQAALEVIFGIVGDTVEDSFPCC